jgi:hypothetical protein
MRIAFAALVAVSCTIFSSMSQAQSTLGDPTPMLGDQGRAIAANAALGGAAMQRSNATSPQEFARREQHKAERDLCDEKFQAQRAT